MVDLDSIYTKYLGYKPGQTGKDFWTGQANKGVSAADIEAAIKREATTKGLYNPTAAPASTPAAPQATSAWDPNRVLPDGRNIKDARADFYSGFSALHRLPDNPENPNWQGLAAHTDEFDHTDGYTPWLMTEAGQNLARDAWSQLGGSHRVNGVEIVPTHRDFDRGKADAVMAGTDQWDHPYWGGFDSYGSNGATPQGWQGIDPKTKGFGGLGGLGGMSDYDRNMADMRSLMDGWSAPGSQYDPSNSWFGTKPFSSFSDINSPVYRPNNDERQPRNGFATGSPWRSTF